MPTANASAPNAAVSTKTRRARRAVLIVCLGALAIATALSVSGALLVPFHFRAGDSPILLPLKWMMSAFVWPLCWLGALCSLLGCVLAVFLWRKRRGVRPAVLFCAVVGFANAAASITAAIYIARICESADAGFARAFGPDWARSISNAGAHSMLPHRWSPFEFQDPAPRLERDVKFWTFPANGRILLADLWLPRSEGNRSGVAFVYLHGSSWHMADKDWGTDVMFRHLAAQGHVVMDVSYRLAPEADLPGMVADARRAVVWMKAHAARYGVDPRRIVLSGASAGGEVALLAAYAVDRPEFATPDLTGYDASVAAAVAYYSPVDMRAFVTSELGKFARTGVRATAKMPLSDPKTHMPSGPMPTEQMMRNVMGGMPDEVPRAYDAADVRSYVTSRSVPALLLQGEFDSVAKIEATRSFASALRAARVPVVEIEFPWTDHAFDLFTSFIARFGARLPFDSRFSPPAQAALYDLDRFLALTLPAAPPSGPTAPPGAPGDRRQSP